MRVLVFGGRGGAERWFGAPRLAMSFGFGAGSVRELAVLGAHHVTLGQVVERGQHLRRADQRQQRQTKHAYQPPERCAGSVAERAGRAEQAGRVKHGGPGYANLPRQPSGFHLICRLACCLVLGSVALSATLPAHANGRFPRADLIVFDPNDSARFVVRTTFGLLESRDAGNSFSWLCESALELADAEDPMLAVTDNGALVASTLDGVLVGGRDECGFRMVPELLDEIVPDLTLDRSDPRRVLAFRARGLFDNQFESQLMLSEDNGESFAPLGDLLPKELLPLSIELAPSNAQRIYLTARLPREEQYASVLLRSDDGGETFESYPLEGTSDLSLAFIAGVAPGDHERLYVRIADPRGTRLMQSTDGGESFELLHQGSGSLAGFAIAPDGETIAFGGPVDGVWVVPGRGEPERRTALGVSCLGWNEDGIYACSNSTQDFAVGRSEDEGRSFERLVAFDELCGNTRCAADTQIGSLCAPAWNAQGSLLGATCNVTPRPAGGAPSGGSSAGGGAGTGVSTQNGGDSGGCAYAPSRQNHWLLLAALVAGVALRRRRGARFAFLPLLAATCACSGSREVEDYDGPPAYPNLRAPFEPEGRRLAYVSNSLSDTVSVLDIDTFEVVADVPVGRDPVGIDGPHHLAIDRERGLLYVALSYPLASASLGPHGGHGLSDLSGYVQRLSLDDLAPLGEGRVDPSPGDVVLSRDGERLFVTHYDLVKALDQTFLDERRATLLWFEPARELGVAAGALRVPVCVAPHGVLLPDDGARAFVACAGEDSVAIVDLATKSVERVPVSDSIGRPGFPIHEPYALLAERNFERLLVSNLSGKSVMSFAVGASLEREWVSPVLGLPYFAAWLAADRVLVPLQTPSGAAVLDAASGELLGEASYRDGECLNPHEAVASSDGRVFLVCEGDHRANGAIVELDPESLAVIRRVEVGVFPDRLLFRDP